MTLALQVTAQAGGRTRTVSQTIRIGGAPFAGFEYAVLANNVNCILCHAEFLALDLEQNSDSDYDNDSDLYGTFDRIKIAILESLLFRTGSAHSYLSGTVYTRGTVMNDKGTPLSASGLASSTFKGHDFDRTNGQLLQNHSTGNKTIAALLNADVDSEGLLEQFGNCYQNYPTEETQMTDGSLPESFPAPFPDVDEDRCVGDSEFAAVMSSMSGSISGGISYGVLDGDVYAGTGLPGASNGASADLAASGSYDGNVILVGTSVEPIILDGDIAINGDLVISGPVQGWGTLQVRGNTYIVGDVTYADAPGEFGQTTSGSENGLAVVSGGSILMGDYLTIRGKGHTNDTSKYPDKAASIHTRDDHISRNKNYKGNVQRLDYGYFDPGATDAGEIQTTMLDDAGNTVTRQGQQFSFTTSELMLFNNLELDKAVADPNYKPRFYGLRDSQPNNLYTYHKGTEEHAVRNAPGLRRPSRSIQSSPWLRREWNSWTSSRDAGSAPFVPYLAIARRK